MVKQRSGAIITIGSIHGSLTSDKRFYEGLGFGRGGPAYQASKGAIINFTRNLAGELGEYGVSGELHQPRADPQAGREAGVRAAVRRQHPPEPGRRAGGPEGRGGAAGNGRVDEWITARTLSVDGGKGIW